MSYSFFFLFLIEKATSLCWVGVFFARDARAVPTAVRRRVAP